MSAPEEARLKKIIRCSLVAIAGALTTRIEAAPPTRSDPLLECHRVYSEVGLIVRTAASSQGRKIGSLKKGEKVLLQGEELSGTGAVYRQMEKD